jgi:dephospho-CoA kinase
LSREREPSAVVGPGWVVLGLTGGIGSGKSTVAALLAERGAVVIDADAISRRIAEPGGAAYQPMIDLFGPAVVRADGSLDRAAIAARAFNDPATLAALNALMHPIIRRQVSDRIAVEAGDGRVVVVDTPLLAETTDPAALAAVIVVDVPTDVAVSRLMGQRGLSEADARARMAAQLSREDRTRLADLVIDNSGDRDRLEAEVERAWQWILALAG